MRLSCSILVVFLGIFLLGMTPQQSWAQDGCTLCPSPTGVFPCPICAPPHNDAIDCPLCCPWPCVIQDQGVYASIAAELNTLKTNLTTIIETYQKYTERLRQDGGDAPYVNPSAIEPHIQQHFAVDPNDSQYKDSVGNTAIDITAELPDIWAQIQEYQYLNEDQQNEGEERTLINQRSQDDARTFQQVIAATNHDIQAESNRSLEAANLGALEAIAAEAEKVRAPDKSNKLDSLLLDGMYLRMMAANNLRSFDLYITDAEQKARGITQQVAKGDEDLVEKNVQFDEYKSQETAVREAIAGMVDDFENEHMYDARKVADELLRVHNTRYRVLAMQEELQFVNVAIQCHRQSILDVKASADAINADADLRFDQERFADLVDSLPFPNYPNSLYPRGAVPENAAGHFVIAPDGIGPGSSGEEIDQAMVGYMAQSAPLSNYLRQLDPTEFFQTARCERHYTANRAAHKVLTDMMTGQTEEAFGVESDCAPIELAIGVSGPGFNRQPVMWPAYCVSEQTLLKYWDNKILSGNAWQGIPTNADLMNDENDYHNGSNNEYEYAANGQIIPEVPANDPYQLGGTTCRNGNGLFEKWLLNDKYERMYRDLRMNFGRPPTEEELQQFADAAGVPLEDINPGDLGNVPIGLDEYIEVAYEYMQADRDYLLEEYGFDVFTPEGQESSFETEQELVDQLKEIMETRTFEEGLEEIQAIEEADTTGQITFGLTVGIEARIQAYNALIGFTDEPDTNTIDNTCNAVDRPADGDTIETKSCFLELGVTEIDACSDCIYYDPNRNPGCLAK